jgi:hypothetical protein
MPEKPKKIYIDFQGGSHGNYLEFVCNRFLAGIPTATALPFNRFNAAHNKQYHADPVFRCNHFTTYGITLTNETVISIHIEPDDLLPLQCVSLLRAGDRDIRPEALEINTYHKLCNPGYQIVLDNLIDNFFNPRDMISAYRAIADPSWPEIAHPQDYHQLPAHIRKECEEVHSFVINRLDPEHPHCPREILVEFFQIGFLDPTTHGFLTTQDTQMHTNCDIYSFPFGCLYDEDKFMKQIRKLSNDLNMPFNYSEQDLVLLHREFLQRQPYKDAKKTCDELVHRMWQQPDIKIPALDVIQEAYVRAMLFKSKES